MGAWLRSLPDRLDAWTSSNAAPSLSPPPLSSQTFICNKLKSYLSWLGHDTKHINVGSYRRLQKPAGQLQSADLFDSNNPVRGGWQGPGGEQGPAAVVWNAVFLRRLRPSDRSGAVGVFLPCQPSCLHSFLVTLPLPMCYTVLLHWMP